MHFQEGKAEDFVVALVVAAPELLNDVIWFTVVIPPALLFKVVVLATAITEVFVELLIQGPLFEWNPGGLRIALGWMEALDLDEEFANVVERHDGGILRP